MQNFAQTLIKHDKKQKKQQRRQNTTAFFSTINIIKQIFHKQNQDKQPHHAKTKKQNKSKSNLLTIIKTLYLIFHNPFQQNTEPNK